MPVLRQLLAGLGYGDPRTHLQSGNAVLTAETEPAETASAVSAAIQTQLDLSIPVIVRTADELAAVVAADPLGDIATDPTKYLVRFLDAPPDPAGLPDEARYAPERYAVRGREVYLWLPKGVHASRLDPALSRALGVATARNWRTVRALLELAER